MARRGAGHAAEKHGVVSRLVLATESTDFEDRVRRAFNGDLNGDLRCWREGFLHGDLTRTVTELVNGTHRGRSRSGPRIPADSALELARAFDIERPEMGVVIVADPSPGLLRAALRGGARDVIAPDASDAGLRAALELALGAAAIAGARSGRGRRDRVDHPTA